MRLVLRAKVVGRRHRVSRVTCSKQLRRRLCLKRLCCREMPAWRPGRIGNIRRGFAFRCHGFARKVKSEYSHVGCAPDCSPPISRSKQPNYGLGAPALAMQARIHSRGIAYGLISGRLQSGESWILRRVPSVATEPIDAALHLSLRECPRSARRERSAQPRRHPDHRLSQRALWGANLLRDGRVRHRKTQVSQAFP